MREEFDMQTPTKCDTSTQSMTTDEKPVDYAAGEKAKLETLHAQIKEEKEQLEREKQELIKQKEAMSHAVVSPTKLTQTEVKSIDM